VSNFFDATKANRDYAVAVPNRLWKQARAGSCCGDSQWRLSPSPLSEISEIIAELIA